MRIWIAILATFVFGAAAHAEVPPTFTYQGVLQDALGNPVPDGSYSVRFKLFNLPTGGTQLWYETKSVTCENGLFSTNLGDTTPLTLPFTDTYWLELTLSGEPPMMPRTQLTAVPYAIRALSAEAGDDGDWVIVGDDIYHVPGQVAIGDTPLERGAVAVREGDENNRFPTDPKLYVDGPDVSVYSTLVEPDAAADERAAIYGLRTRTVRNDGSGYGVTGTNNAITGYNYYGDSYTFGVAGYTWFDWPQTAGVLGARSDGSTWGALGYRDAGNLTWGVYSPNSAYVGGDMYVNDSAFIGSMLATNAFQMPSGAAEGYVLTSSNSVGYASWEPAPTGFTLPYSGSAATSGPAFEVNNTYVGANAAIEGNSSGYYGGYFTASRGSAYTHVLHAEATASGYYDARAVYGKSRTTENYGYGGYFEGGYKGVYAYVNAEENNSSSYYGVDAEVDGQYGYVYGVRGRVTNGDGLNYGVFGRAAGLGGNYGVYGEAVGGVDTYGGYFSGDVHVTGTLSKSGGSFKIDHPLDPENKYLSHSFVESPDMMNVYNGNVVLDAAGEAWVAMPDWFEALNRDFRYQLTAIGAPGPNLYVGEKMTGNRFMIAGGSPGLEVSWQVTGIRQDPYAEQNRIQVEEHKRSDEQGKYLNPELYGQPRSAGLHQPGEDLKDEAQQ